MENSVCVIQVEVEVGIVVDSVEMVRPEHVFLDEDMARNKYWVGIVKCSEVQRLVEYCCLIYR